MADLIDTVVYAARIKDRDVLNSSSSGGAFTALSDFFLEHGDAVVASAYDYYEHAVKYQLMQSKEQRDQAKGSKYIQSKPCDIFQQAYQWLVDHPHGRLLFVGTGCQAEGFRQYVDIKKVRDRVWIVDIVCHGSPSPKLWREYAQQIQNRNKGTITYLTFKDKRNGWISPTAYAEINGEEVGIEEYVRIFYNQCVLRPSCYECPYATAERKTDITIGDFWHIEETIPDFYDKYGNSLFLIHTNQGEKLFNAIKVNLEYRLSDTKQCWQENLEAPTKRSEQRDKFWNDYQKKGVYFIMKKYGTTPLKSKIKNKIVKLISIGGGAKPKF